MTWNTCLGNYECFGDQCQMQREINKSVWLQASPHRPGCADGARRDSRSRGHHHYCEGLHGRRSAQRAHRASREDCPRQLCLQRPQVRSFSCCITATNSLSPLCPFQERTQDEKREYPFSLLASGISWLMILQIMTLSQPADT